MFGALLVGALQPVELALNCDPHRLGQLGGLGAVLRHRALAVAVLTELLADGGHLLAQQELPLGLLHPLGDVGLDALLQGQVGKGVACPDQHLLQAVLHVDGLQHLHLLFEGKVGGVTGGVGHGARVGDATQGLGQAAGAAIVEDVLDDGAVLLGQLP